MNTDGHDSVAAETVRPQLMRFGKAVRVNAVAAPATTLFFGAVFLVGLASGGFWSRNDLRPWWSYLTTGVGPLTAGRWWTVLTAPYIGGTPWEYAALILGGGAVAGLVERRRGWRVMAALLAGGYLGGLAFAVGFAAALQHTGWVWPAHLAAATTAGPWGGVVALAVFALGPRSAVWRFRGRTALLTLLVVLLLLVGGVTDVERFVVGAITIGFAWRGRTRVTVAEWRGGAAFLLLATAAIPVVAATTTTHGPLGASQPNGQAWWEVGLSVVVGLVLVRSLRAGKRTAAILVTVIAALHVVAAVVIISALTILNEAQGQDGVILGGTVMWAGLLAVLLAGTRAFRVPLRRQKRTLSYSDTHSRDLALDALKEHGGGTLSWMTTWPGMEYVFDEEGSGVAGVQHRGGVIICLGDPILSPDRLDPFLANLDDSARTAGVIPCLFSVGETTRAGAPAGWRSILVADDTVLDLPGLELVGKKWQPARGAINRAEREGISFRLVHLHEQPWAVTAQVRAISEAWVGDKALPEMGFTLGGVREALDPHVRTAIAIDEDGSVHGVLSWLPVYAPGGTVRGWTLDLMRRRDGGFSPVIEYLIIESALTFRDEGAEFLSLSGGPLAGESTGASPVQQVIDRLGALLEPVYGFRSLHVFKNKFNPRYEPLYLLFRDEADLPAIAIALTRAFLPTASALDLARAGLTLPRRAPSA